MSIATYKDICPEGTTMLTATYTSTKCPTCPSSDIPPGWISTTKVCTVCGATPTTLTLTLPPTAFASPTPPPSSETPGTTYTTVVQSKLPVVKRDENLD